MGLKNYALILCFVSFMQDVIGKQAIIIGASSGMGREIAKQLSQEGYILGLVARRRALLESLQHELKGQSYIKQIDITHNNARRQLQEFIDEIGGIDLIIISISPYLDNKRDQEQRGNDLLTWSEKERIIDVCFKGFIAQAEVAIEVFKKQGYGHLIGVTSKAGLRGKSGWPEYSGAKAGISCYLQGVRNYMIQHNLNIYVTDVIAGFVAVEHSPLGGDHDAYWEVSVESAGKIIMEGIKKHKKIIYVPKKIQLIALLHMLLPDWLYNRYFTWL